MSYYDDHEFIEVVVKCRHATDEVVEFTGEEIIRCKECKHRGFYLEDADMYICNACDQLAFDPMHFCSYGEREGE